MRFRNGYAQMNWTELLKPENGGPGDSPNRPEAIARAAVRSQEKALRKGGKRK